VSTILASAQVPLSERSTNCSLDSSTERRALDPKLPAQGMYANLLGIIGTVITLTVLASGLYVFFRYLL
jgi:hypothetical protein